MDSMVSEAGSTAVGSPLSTLEVTPREKAGRRALGMRSGVEVLSFQKKKVKKIENDFLGL